MENNLCKYCGLSEQPDKESFGLNKILDKARSRKAVYRCSKKPMCLFNSLLKDVSRKATKEDYLLWLEGFLKNKGEITHVYDYPINMTDFIFIEKDFYMSPLYGAQSIGLIIKKGVKCLGGDKGHNELYYMDNFSQKGDFVPIYSDLSF